MSKIIIDNIDLFLNKNQINIGSNLLNFYDLNELEQLLNDFSEKDFEYKRDISEKEQIYYFKTFDSGNYFKLTDIINTNTYPFRRYMKMDLYKKKKNNINSFECRMRKNILIYLAVVIALAINFINYKNSDEKLYNRKTIINNFSNELAQHASSIGILYQMKFIVDYITNENKILNNKKFIYSFCLDNIHFKIISNKLNLIKFQYIDRLDKSDHYIYLKKNHTGVYNISSIIEKALNKKSRA